ncbi:MAG: hypothetical protein CVV37_02295 [Nitrospira bacterium HGW-Nitrospira-1]|nr:MAG: hypothetical protein CVV37_02295 [Nitrospira bacterium HGW-Nitrospira-1]
MHNHLKIGLSVFILILLIITVITAIPAGAFYLPDTGQTTCYGDKGRGKVITCPPPGNPLAQDGSYTINPPSYTVNSDGTVTDNNTFLIWQQGIGNFYGIWDQANAYCMNLSIAGRSDWRLPSKNELASIVDYGKYNPALDASVFTHIGSTYHWSSTQDSANAWSVSFGDGSIQYRPKYGNAAYAKCVRGEMKLGDLRYDDKGMLNDLDTGLMWGGSGRMKWGYALKYCEGLSLAWHTDWRLPNMKELMSLTESYNTATSPGDYWTSTTNAADTDNAWAVSFPAGAAVPNIKRERDNRVICVRGEKVPPLDYREISVAPSGLEFGYVGINESKSLELTVTNVGRDVLAVGDPLAPSAPFSITAHGCAGSTLNGWDSCQVTVTFAPASSGTYIDAITLTSNDADNPHISINLSGTAFDPATGFLLPDTGQTSCYTDMDSVISCPAPGNPLAQDGSYLMNAPSFSVNTNGTAGDNNTGLMWQRSDDGTARTWTEAADYCHDLALGGYGEWRLPTKSELFSIVDFGRYSPSINLSVFPNAKTDGYWSFSANQTFTDIAWNVFFGRYRTTYCFPAGGDWNNYDGVAISGRDKSGTKYVRCVRGEVLPFGVFSDNGDGTVTDSASELLWQQGNSAPMAWAGALGYCEDLTLGGYPDWRLPNAKELESISREADASFFFPEPSWCGSGCAYWSSTSLGVIDCGLFWGDTLAYAASPLSGWFGKKSKSAAYNARCVRGGNTALPSALTGAVTDSATTLSLSGVTVAVADSQKTYTTTSGPDGTYAVSGLNAGSFTATFLKSGYITQTTNGTLAAGQTLTLNVQLTPIPLLTVTITSPQDGAVLNSFPITVTGNASNNAGVTVNGIQASISSNTFSASVSLNEGQDTITATAVDQYNQTASHSINVTLITKGTITGTVTDATGLPLSSAVVSVTDSLNVTQTTLTGADGTYAIAGISSGTFSLSVTKNGYTTYSFTATITQGQTIIINAALSAIPPTIGNIAISNLTANSATVTWTTDQPSSTFIEYGTTTSYGSSMIDSTLTTSHSITLLNLTSSTTYHFKVTSTNSYGFSSSSGDNTFTTASPPSSITLTITSPSNGETINKPDVMVRGTITNTTGNETGVTVNGIPATAYGNQFIANHVPLQEGTNTITVTTTDTTGNTATTSITVNAVTTGNYIRLTSNIESGISPLDAVLRIDGSFSIASSNLNIVGPTQPEIISSSPDEYKVKFIAEGIYYFTASATGPDGNVYQDTISIIVLNKNQIDTLLKAKWERMKGALASQDVESGLIYFLERFKESYRQALNVITDELPRIVSDMQNIEMIYLAGNVAKYRINRVQNIDGIPQTLTYYIYFVREANGIWKIDRF